MTAPRGSEERRRLEREEVDAIAERLGELLEALEARAEPSVVAAVAEIVDGLQKVHAEGLRRMVELLARDPDRLARALDDPVISNLLVLYDLVVVDERSRAQEALEEIRPLARSHGGEIQLVRVEHGVVQVRLHGACHGCPSSTATLRQGIERALGEKLPGFVRLEVLEPDGASTGGISGPGRGAGAPRQEPSASGHGLEASGAAGYESQISAENLVKLERRAATEQRRASSQRSASGTRGNSRSDRSPARLAVAPLYEVPRAGLFGRLVEGVPILLIRLNGRGESRNGGARLSRPGSGLRAYRNVCPGSLLPLHLGTLEEGEIRCPWHGCRFDVDTGRRLDVEGPALESLPVRLEDGRVWVTVRA